MLKGDFPLAMNSTSLQVLCMLPNYVPRCSFDDISVVTEEASELCSHIYTVMSALQEVFSVITITLFSD